MSKSVTREDLLTTVEEDITAEKILQEAYEIREEAENEAELAEKAMEEISIKIAELDKREERIVHLHKEVRRELEQVNKYHPELDKSIDCPQALTHAADILNYRFVGPEMTQMRDDGRRQHGQVKLYFKTPKSNGIQNVALFVTEEMLEDNFVPHMDLSTIEDMAKYLTQQLLHMAANSHKQQTEHRSRRRTNSMGPL